MGPASDIVFVFIIFFLFPSILLEHIRAGRRRENREFDHDLLIPDYFSYKG